MNPFRSTSARAYQDIGLETSIGSASPHQLILMLYDAALNAIGEARLHMRSRNIAAKGAAISRAIRIIGEGLWASLDMDRGGSLAAQMGGLYSYMSKRLVEANLHNREDMLAEVQGLLGELRSAWVQIGARPAQHAAPVAVPMAQRDRRVVSYGAV
jgi:flagellar protein FliS